MAGEFSQARPRGADTEGSMKAIAIVFAESLSPHALVPSFGGESALKRSLSAASRLPAVEETVLFCDGELEGLLPSHIPEGREPRVVCQTPWTVKQLFEALGKVASAYDHVYFIHGDEPLLDLDFSASLWERHVRYASEYTFADGYPQGLAPQILASGVIPALARLAGDSAARVPRDVLFETFKKDINSFDIETDIAPADMRQLRVLLACDSKRNAEQTLALRDITAENNKDLLSSRASALYTLPAFYALQVSGRCPFECNHCPYPPFSRSGTGISPGLPVTERRDYLEVSRFAALMDKIAAYSEDAVISLSLQGEPAYHPDVPALAEAVLRHPGLSLFIETTGIGWRDETLDALAESVRSYGERTGGKSPIDWVVSLDALGSACYGRNRGLDEEGSSRLLKEAVTFVERAESRFPGRVWPQFLRMRDNEEELEGFYRLWNERLGRVIVQKHDHFCGTLRDMRVADLSPLVRHPCWHLKRDMSILMDGTVPLCREDMYGLIAAGNAFTEDLSAIRERLRPVYESHCSGNYEGLCSACDEYYTFNF